MAPPVVWSASHGWRARVSGAAERSSADRRPLTVADETLGAGVVDAARC